MAADSCVMHAMMLCAFCIIIFINFGFNNIRTYIVRSAHTHWHCTRDYVPAKAQNWNTCSMNRWCRVVFTSPRDLFLFFFSVSISVFSVEPHIGHTLRVHIQEQTNHSINITKRNALHHTTPHHTPNHFTLMLILFFFLSRDCRCIWCENYFIFSFGIFPLSHRCQCQWWLSRSEKWKTFGRPQSWSCQNYTFRYFVCRSSISDAQRMPKKTSPDRTLYYTKFFCIFHRIHFGFRSPLHLHPSRLQLSVRYVSIVSTQVMNFTFGIWKCSHFWVFCRSFAALIPCIRMDWRERDRKGESGVEDNKKYGFALVPWCCWFCKYFFLPAFAPLP